MLPGDSLKAQCRSPSELKLLGSQFVCEGSQYLRVFFHVLILKTTISLGVSISRRRKALPLLSDTKYLRLALRSSLSYISFPGAGTVYVPHRLTLSHSEVNQECSVLHSPWRKFQEPNWRERKEMYSSSPSAFQPHPKGKRLGNTSAHRSWGRWMSVINHSAVERPSSSQACHYISTAVSRAGILDMNLRAYSCSISKQHTTPSLRKDVPTHKEKQV